MTKVTIDKSLLEQAIEELSDVLGTSNFSLRTKLRAAMTEPASEGKLFHAKFNVGDCVWYMKNNKPTEVVISAIEVFFVNTNQDQITYNAKNATNSSWLDHAKLQEACLFRTKAELLESL